MICPDCHGDGVIERVNWNGPYDIACPYCWESRGEVPDEDDDE